MKRLLPFLFLLPLAALGVDPVNTNRLPWSLTWSNYVGVSGGIPSPAGQTMFTNFTPSATAAMVNNAVANCPSNQFVYCTNGTYSFGSTAIVMTKNGAILRGGTNANGWPATIFNTSADPSVVMGDDGFDTSTGTGWSTVNVNSGAARGATTVTLASIPTGCAVRSLLWFSAPPGGVVDGGSFALFLGTNPYCQIVEVTGVSGNDVSFWPPLAGPWATKATTRTAQTSHVRMGLENIRFGGNNNTYVRMEGTSECWIYNCQITNSPSGSIRQVWLYTTSRTEIRHSILGSISADGSDAYSIFGQDSSGTLVIDNIFKDSPNFFPQMGSTYTVFAYNYVTNCPYNQVPGWLSQIVYNHGAFNDYNLYEQNHMPTAYDDGLDNNPADPSVQFCMTWLRNVLVGWDGSDGGKIYNCRALSMLEPSYSNNIVLNILGKTGFHDNYAPSSFTSETKAIYDFGTPITSNSVARFNNWNAVDGGIRALEVTSGTIVNSYLDNSKPAFFGNLTWPAYGSNVTAASTSPTNIPAGWRITFGADVPADSDTTPPTLSSATIGTDGVTLTLAFDDTMAIGAGGNGGWAFTMSGGAVTATYSSGSGTSSLVYSLSRTVYQGETKTAGLDYTQPGNGLEDDSGNDLASIDDAAVTNNSTQVQATATLRSIGRIGRVGP